MWATIRFIRDGQERSETYRIEDDFDFVLGPEERVWLGALVASDDGDVLDANEAGAPVLAALLRDSGLRIRSGFARPMRQAVNMNLFVGMAFNPSETETVIDLLYRSYFWNSGRKAAPDVLAWDFIRQLGRDLAAVPQLSELDGARAEFALWTAVADLTRDED